MRLSAFTDFGYFWLSDDEDQNLRVAGTLAVSEFGHVTLKTFGYLSHDPLSLAHDWPPSKHQRIFGYTLERGAVTLVGNIVKHFSNQVPASGVWFTNCEFWADNLLTGGHFDDAELLFNRLTCKIEGLDEWLWVSGIERPDVDRENDRFTITYQRPDAITFQVGKDGVEGMFGFEYSLSLSDPWAMKVQTLQNAFIELSTSVSWTVKDVVRWATQMRDFLCLGTDAPVAITSLEGYLQVDGQPDPAASDRENPVRIFFQSAQHSPEPANVKPLSGSFAYRDIDHRLSESLTKWIDLYHECPQPVALFFDARYRAGELPLELQFRRVAEALETLAPAKGARKKSGLRERVMYLAKPFAELVGMGVCGCEQEFFAKRVADTRNWYTHRGKKKGKVSEGADLFRLLQQCEALLICHLTASVLGDETAAIQVLQDAESIKRRVRVG